VGLREILGAGAVIVISAALIALIWISAERSIREQTDDTRARVEATLNAQVATLAVAARHEMQMVDQTLTLLQANWNANHDNFSLTDWRKKLPGLADVTSDLFIANDKQVITQDTNPAAVGVGLGSAYTTSANGSLESIGGDGPHTRDADLPAGDLGPGAVYRQYPIYLGRRLAEPQGWLVGALYRSRAFTTNFILAGLGEGGIAAIVESQRGAVPVVAGTAALRPTLEIGDSPLFAAMQARPDGGTWTGMTPIDGVERIMAFRRIPDRDLFVLMGEVRAQAMAPADTWAEAVNGLAILASLLIVAIGVAVSWELWHWRSTRRRTRALAQAEASLASVQTDLATTRARAAAGMTQTQAILAGVSEGVAVIDSARNLAAWNPRFAAQSHLAEGTLREGLPLQDLLRAQVLAGRFGAPGDVEAGVARLTALLPEKAGLVAIQANGADGTHLVLRAQAAPDGGMVLILRPAEATTAHAVAEDSTTADPVAIS
jgi:PAS domain-containing protein